MYSVYAMEHEFNSLKYQNDILHKCTLPQQLKLKSVKHFYVFIDLVPVYCTVCSAY